MPRRRSAVLSAGLLLGVCLDALVVDPARLHPVAGFGTLAGRLERLLWRPSRSAGTAHLLLCLVPVAAAARGLDRMAARRPPVRAVYVGLLAWSVIGASGLRREAGRVEQSLLAGDIDAARLQLKALCGRDASVLDVPALRRAVIESVAENTSDAAVAPLVWAALAGAAGLVGYRCVNTLDAMVGHRSVRYERFGFASARVDDAANLLPARLTALLAVAFAGSVGGRAGQAHEVWRRDAAGHPSPNAGPCEAAFAGALGVRLGGPIAYPYGVSDRPWLGDGRDPGPDDVARCIVLSRRIVNAAAILCAAAALAGCSR